MPLVKKTVSYGSFGRDYDSFAAFVAGLNNATYPTPGTVVVGELYNDAVFDEHSITVSALGSNISGLVITAAPGQWHQGNPLAGVCFKPTSNHSTILAMSTPVGFRVEKIRFDSNGNNTGTGRGIIENVSGVDSGNPRINHWDRVIVTGGSGFNNARAMRGLNSANRPALLTNSLLYSIRCNGAATSTTGFMVGGDDKIRIYNCTLDLYEWANSSSVPNYGVGYTTDASSTIVENTVITRIGDSGFGTACLDTVIGNNVATDDTTGDISSITIADEFVDHVNADYNIKAGADCEGAGSVLTNMVNMIDKDITGQERSASAWDIGAYNNRSGYVASGGGSSGYPASRLIGV
ncbi:MAG: hypothetical protein KDB00_10845 [Planctomycetales bacterium]|nr:hypothetical protein [Planctomycetales bacterium]